MMNYRVYENGQWRRLSEESNEYPLMINFEREPGAEEIIKKGFDNSVILRDGCLQDHFFAKQAPCLPKDVLSLIDSVFPFFFSGKISINPIPDVERGVGLIVLDENSDELQVSWALSCDKYYDDMEAMSVPLQVDKVTLMKRAEIDTLGLDLWDFFAEVPVCLRKYYSDIESVEQRRCSVLNNSISVLNKSLQLLGSSFMISSISIYVDVSPCRGISTEEFGYGYRVTGVDEVGLVYYALNGLELWEV